MIYDLRNTTVLFMGDSITDDGRYVAIIDALLRRMGANVKIVNAGVSSETVSGLTEPEHPFPRPCGLNRIQRALELVRPDWVVCLYGVNDGIYYPFSEERADAYIDGITALADTIHDSGARVALLTPTVCEIPEGRGLPLGAPKYGFQTPFENYDVVMERYAELILNCNCADVTIDIHAVLKNAQLNGPVTQDGIHPNMAGHFAMAKEVLRRLFAAYPDDIEQVLGEGRLLETALRYNALAHHYWKETIGHDCPYKDEMPSQAELDAAKAEYDAVCAGEYINPILEGDYSDPDAIRVGDDYYMIASSFTYFPGIPLLHSRDMVHWSIVNHIAPRLPFTSYDAPRHKCGIWAPSIRYHDGTFYVYVCTPDEGLLAFTATDPLKKWQCHYVKDVSGWIDPCPFWDDDGQAYLVHAFAGSRAGIKSRLYLHRMAPDGFSILDNGTEIFNGTDTDDTVEGPKMYRLNGKYFILAPAGGVKSGWQLALRADSPLGPYEKRRVLEQKDSIVNGPHQGGLLDTPDGASWFVHFQDRGVYGRVVHLQPVKWENGWPVMGREGAPVLASAVPHTGMQCDARIQTSDDFTGNGLGLQWQWQAHANFAWYDLKNPGLRLYAAPAGSLFHAGQFLSQNMQTFISAWEVTLKPHFETEGDCAGLGVMGYEYAYVARFADEIRVITGSAREIDRRTPEAVEEKTVCAVRTFRHHTGLRMEIEDGRAYFYYKDENGAWEFLYDFEMSAGGWTGTRPGIFCGNFSGRSGAGWADFAYVHISGIR